MLPCIPVIPCFQWPCKQHPASNHDASVNSVGTDAAHHYSTTSRHQSQNVHDALVTCHLGMNTCCSSIAACAHPTIHLDLGMAHPYTHTPTAGPVLVRLDPAPYSFSMFIPPSKLLTCTYTARTVRHSARTVSSITARSLVHNQTTVKPTGRQNKRQVVWYNTLVGNKQKLHHH